MTDLDLDRVRQEELAALLRENNSELFFSGLLGFAHRLESQDRLEAALRVYDYLRTAGAGKSVPLQVQSRAIDGWNAIVGRGSLGPRVEFLLARLSHEATEPTAIFAMAAAGAAFKLSRAMVATRLATLPGANLFTRGAGLRITANLSGFGAESVAFTLSSKAAGAALGRGVDWNPQILGLEWCAGALVLGSLKLMGGLTGAVLKPWAGNSSLLHGYFRRALPQAGMLNGILLGNFLAAQAGIRPSLEGETSLLDGLATLIHFNVGGYLSARAFGSKLQPWERRLDLSLESSNERPPIGNALNWATSLHRKLQAAPTMDPEARPLQLWMSGGDEGGPKKGRPKRHDTIPEFTDRITPQTPDPAEVEGRKEDRPPIEPETLLNHKVLPTLVMPGRKGRPASFNISETVHLRNLEVLRSWEPDPENEYNLRAQEFGAETINLELLFDVQLKWATLVFNAKGELGMVLDNPWRTFHSPGTRSQSKSGILGVDVLIRPGDKTILWYDSWLQDHQAHLGGAPLGAMEALYRAAEVPREDFLGLHPFARDVAVAQATPRLLKMHDSTIPEHFGFLAQDLVRILSLKGNEGIHRVRALLFIDRYGNARADTRPHTGTLAKGSAQLEVRIAGEFSEIRELRLLEYKSEDLDPAFGKKFHRLLRYIHQRSAAGQETASRAAMHPPHQVTPADQRPTLRESDLLPTQPMPAVPRKIVVPATLAPQAGKSTGIFRRIFVDGWRKIFPKKAREEDLEILNSSYDPEAVGWKPVSSFFLWDGTQGLYRFAMPKGIREIAIGRADFEALKIGPTPHLEKISAKHIKIHHLKTGEYYLDIPEDGKMVLLNNAGISPGRGAMLHRGDVVTLGEGIAFIFDG